MGEDLCGLVLRPVSLPHIGEGLRVYLVAVIEGITNAPDHQGAVTGRREAV
jgi:hypothetical protein